MTSQGITAICRAVDDRNQQNTGLLHNMSNKLLYHSRTIGRNSYVCPIPYNVL